MSATMRLFSAPDQYFPSGYGQVTGGLYYTNTYENIGTLVENKNINTILLVSTSTDPCEYCYYYSTFAIPGIKALCTKYGMGVHTWNNGTFLGKKINFSTLVRCFGMTGTTYPAVALVPNPRNLANNTNSWYAANMIKDFSEQQFSSQRRAEEFPEYLETILQSYTNLLPYVSESTIRGNISETSTTIMKVLDSTTYVTIRCNPYVREGDNLLISFSRSGSLEDALTIHLLESEKLIQSITWDAGSGSEKYVVYRVSQDDDFDDERVLKFSVKSLYRKVLLK